MTWGINDSDFILGTLEFPQRNVDGNTTLTLGLELVKDPGILERTLVDLYGDCVGLDEQYGI